ncbi:MAG: thioredoxin family protein [Planctomycetales bacterium]|nr:thioredoxin family protein [Planctomycetales bacterium]
MLLTMVALMLIAAPAFAADEQIVWQTDIAKAIQQAKVEKKLVLVHFYGDSCAPCRLVEQKVFPQPQVVQAVMRNYVPVKINVDKTEKIASHYGIRSIPTDVFLSSAGQEFHRNLTSPSVTDYVSLLDQLAIQTGIGSARQAALSERDSRSDTREPVAEQPPAQQQYVENQFAAQNRNVGNRYVQAGGAKAGQPQPQGAGVNPAPVQAGNEGQYGSRPALPQDGPYGSRFEQPPAQPTTVPGFAPQGKNGAPPSQISMQRANFQDPGDITARQPIQNQYIPVKDAPPVGLEGFCPVSLKEASKWKKGDKQYGAIHRGRTYLFASAAEQQKFLADPDAYSPVLSGADPVIFAEQGQLVDGNRNYGVALPNGDRSEMYFFATPESRDRFEKNPRQYAITAHQAMLKSETERKLR